MTFDDGWSPSNCSKILSTLESQGVMATFFPYANAMYADKAFWRKVAKDGYPIANHTTTHPHMPTLSLSDQIAQINNARIIAEGITDYPMLRVFRPPYGDYNSTTVAAASQAGFNTVLLWDTSDEDTAIANVPQEIADAERGTDGSVVLMHCGPATTPSVVGPVIDYYRSRGFSFVTVAQMFNVPWDNEPLHPTVPMPPTGVTAIGYDGSVSVSWNPPVDNGGRPISGYTVTSSPEGRTCTTGDTNCPITGLANDTIYTFTVIATNSLGAGPASDPSPGVLFSSAATYHPLTPTRILDTRYGVGLAGPFSSHVARTFQVTGIAGVPANASAVTGNLTVTGQRALGYLYIGPVATNYPTSSTLNFPLNDDRANGVTVALSAGGTLSVTYVAPTLGPSAQAVFDVTGYFTPDASGATYHPLTPTRILDTRYGVGLSDPLSSHVARTFAVTGIAGVPADAVAVTGNLTVTGQTAIGYLFIGPNAVDDPTSSTLNFPVGDDRANGVTVALGTGGTLSVTYAAPTLGPTAQAIFDVTGYFTPDASGAVYHPLVPIRILDTRYANGLAGAFNAQSARTFAVTGRGGVPTGAVAATGNLTVTGQTAPGYLFLAPAATNSPTSSTLNFPLGDNRANGATVALGTGGTLSVVYISPTNGARAQVIFDVSGYFLPAPGG